MQPSFVLNVAYGIGSSLLLPRLIESDATVGERTAAGGVGMETRRLQTVEFPYRVWFTARVVLAAVLVYAAIQKIRSVEEFNGLVSLHHAVAFDVGVAVGLAFWRGSTAWCVAFAAFSLFLVISVWHVISGENCGCLGDAGSAEVSVVLDVLVLLLLALLRGHAKAVPERGVFKGVATVGCVFVVVASVYPLLRWEQSKDLLHLGP